VPALFSFPLKVLQPIISPTVKGKGNGCFWNMAPHQPDPGPDEGRPAPPANKTGTPRQRTARAHGGGPRAQLPALRLDRVLPDVVRSATARQSLRGMTRGERRPLTNMFSTGASSSPRAARPRQHGSQTERIRTADSRSALLSASSSLVGVDPNSMGVAHLGETLSQAREAARTGPAARQDQLPGTEYGYSDVHARVSNVCSMHLAQRRHELQLQTEARKEGIYRSVTNENDPGVMVATKAHATGVPAALPKVDRAHRPKPVQGMRPPSPSQSGLMEQLVFEEDSGLFSNDRRLQASTSQDYASSSSSIFLTETRADGDETIRRTESEEGEGTGGGKANMFDPDELDKEVTQRLQKVRSTVKPVVKHVSVVNEAIKVWLKGGARHVKIHHDKAITKNNFDSNGKLAKNNQFERIRTMLHDQKDIISHPHIDLHLTDHLRELSKSDFVGYNMEFVDAVLPQVRNANLLRQLVKREKGVEQVLANRHKVAQEKLARVHLDVERKLPGAKKLRCTIRAQAMGLDIEIRQLIAGVAAVRALRMFEYLVCVGRVYHIRRAAAARKIQKVLRMCMIVRSMRGTEGWARRKIVKFFRECIQRYRQNNRGPYVEVIKRFLFDASAANRTLKAAKLLKAVIRRLQRFCRVCFLHPVLATSLYCSKCVHARSHMCTRSLSASD
jgi:hypothetical protein